MIHKAATPPALYQVSNQAKIAEKRAADLDEIVSVQMRELFPDIREAIYAHDYDDLSVIRNATEKSLENVDMSMIKPKDTVNICVSEHGFAIVGGKAYAEMIKTIKEIVEKRTGNENIRLRLACAEQLDEGRNMIPQYGLDKTFDNIVLTWPFSEGVAIETAIGTLYGLKAIFDADHIIHVNYTDPREYWFNRNLDRILKIFTMAYARYETRSTFHISYASPWVNNSISRP